MADTFKQKKIIRLGSEKVGIGERKKIFLYTASLYDYTNLNIPLEVIRGTEPGPTLFISAAIHGDEINGVEIIKRLLAHASMKKIRGTFIAVPVVNVFGFNHKSRYLPDRRDLNRSFPGSSKGSLAGRMAHIFMKEVVSQCTHGIDLHTGAIHRTNLPQIRACLDDPETKKLAESFNVPVVIDSQLRDGSLREAARKKRVKTLLFEGGEALRFEEDVIKSGVKGCLSVMREIGLLPKLSKNLPPKQKSVYVAKDSYWLRAPHSGSFRALKKSGDKVQAGDVLAVVSDLFGDNRFEVKADMEGIVIGMSTIPLVNKGDAMFHIAVFRDAGKVKKAMRLLDDQVL